MTFPQLAPYIIWAVTTLVAVGIYVQQIRQARRDREAMKASIAERAMQRDLEGVRGDLDRLERRFDEGPRVVMTALDMIDRRLQRIEAIFDEKLRD